MNNFKFIPNQEHFQKIRQKTIGASDVPIILGLSKYKTPYQLWREKTGRDLPFEGNQATKWGHRHEPNIIASYIEEVKNNETAKKFLLDYIFYADERNNYRPITNYYPFTEFFHPELTWAMAHPDCIDIENNINIEAKSGKLFANLRRDNFDGFDPDDPKGYPLKYYIQCQWQMLCSGINDTVLRALIDTNQELNYNIKANKKIQEKLIDITAKFYWHIQNNKEPQPINQDDIKKMFPEVQNKTHYLLGAKSEMGIKLKSRKEFLSDKIKKYESEVKDINDAMFLLIGDNKYLYSEDNQKLCSQIMFNAEKIKGAKEIKEIDENLYNQLKEKGLIYENETRYIR